MDKAITMRVGDAVPEGLVVLDSCGTCEHCLPAGVVGLFCDLDGSFLDSFTSVEWHSWSASHRTLGNLWCPGFARCGVPLRLVRGALSFEDAGDKVELKGGIV